MAGLTLSRGARAANMSRRRMLSLWKKRVAALNAASDRLAATPGDVVRDRPGEVLADIFGPMCVLLLTPAPDLGALLAKLELAYAHIFIHDPGIAEIAAALCDDARRLAGEG